MKKNICVFTGTRAEYGLLKPLMDILKGCPKSNLQILCTGMHLTHQHGHTIDAILKDGFSIDKQVDMLLSSGTKSATVKSMGLGMVSFADALSDLAPDCVVILGDRFEALACAQTCLILNIPVVHLHGGEITEGLIDEGIRHSITKMASLHLTANELYRKRIIQMGEHPDSVVTTGAPGIDNIIPIKKNSPMTKEQLGVSLGVTLNDQMFAMTYHPVTLSRGSQSPDIGEILSALSQYPDTSIVITAPNSDPDSYEILNQIQKFCDEMSNAHLFTSLGQQRYLTLLKHSDLVIGNSSSGIIEAPFLDTPTIDIGPRQQGRERGTSVFSCGPISAEIKNTINTALNFQFDSQPKESVYIYGHGEASQKAYNEIQNFLEKPVGFKKFYDLEFSL